MANLDIQIRARRLWLLRILAPLIGGERTMRLGMRWAQMRIGGGRWIPLPRSR